MRLLSVLSSLWPAALVWLLVTMPALAWHAPDLQRHFTPLPSSLRILLWLAAHVWPYSKIYRVAEWFAHLEAERHSQRLEDEQKTLLTSVRSITRLPSRLDLGLPPLSVAEAEAWMAARLAAGEASSAWTSAGSTSESPA